MEEERIALFLDYENLAIGTRDKLEGLSFDFRPLAEALAERGRVVVRRAYADWSYFREDRRMLTMHQVELIEIPQRMGIRKNAADIKMAVDAMELCFERDYLTTFVIGTGDSDFTPLVHKLRALNKRVIGVGVQASTSPLLPPACDEFLFYEQLEGVEVPRPKRGAAKTGRSTSASTGTATGTAAGTATGTGTRTRRAKAAPRAEDEPRPKDAETEELTASINRTLANLQHRTGDIDELMKLVSQTLAGLQRGTGDVVLGSMLKRALLRKDPTFSEAGYGFRTFGELLRFLDERKVITLGDGAAKGDPVVNLPEGGGGEDEAFTLLRDVVAELEAKGSPTLMSGLKNQLRKRQPAFSEKKLGYNGFLQFCKAASTRGVVTLAWNEEADDYVLGTVTPAT